MLSAKERKTHFWRKELVDGDKKWLMERKLVPRDKKLCARKRIVVLVKGKSISGGRNWLLENETGYS